MMPTPLQAKLNSLELRLNDLCATQDFEALLNTLNDNHDFIHELDISRMNDTEKQAFVSFSKTHHEVMLSVKESRNEVLDELKKRALGKKKIRQYKGVRNSAG